MTPDPEAEAMKIAEAVAADADGFRGHFEWRDEDEHTGDRLVLIDKEGDEHIISDTLDRHVAEPLASMLNGAGPIARALLAMSKRLAAVEAGNAKERAVVEIRASRALRLTPEERDALKIVRDDVSELVRDPAYHRTTALDDANRVALGVLDRLLACPQDLQVD